MTRRLLSWPHNIILIRGVVSEQMMLSYIGYQTSGSFIARQDSSTVGMTLSWCTSLILSLSLTITHTPSTCTSIHGGIFHPQVITAHSPLPSIAMQHHSNNHHCQYQYAHDCRLCRLCLCSHGTIHLITSSVVTSTSQSLSPYILSSILGLDSARPLAPPSLKTVITSIATPVTTTHTVAIVTDAFPST